jgi:hypothetical protein
MRQALESFLATSLCHGAGRYSPLMGSQDLGYGVCPAPFVEDERFCGRLLRVVSC